MSTASGEKCCSFGVHITALHEYKMQYTQARVTGALQVPLKNYIMRLQSSKKFNTLSQNKISKIKVDKKYKKARTFLILYLFYENINLSSSS